MNQLFMRLVLAVLAMLMLIQPAKSQFLPDTSMVYIHNKPASFNARFLQFGMVVLGMKNRSFSKQFDQSPAHFPASLKRKYNVSVTEHQGRRVWTIVPMQNASSKVILYLHGGAYVENLLSFHWDLIGQLLVKTNATIVVPDYPLAPNAQCPEVLAFAVDLYKQLLVNHSPQNITIMGDSAGGGLALSLAQEVRNHALPQPTNIVLLAPWLDVSLTNPGIADVDAKDKMLNVPRLQVIAKLYAGKLGITHPQVSPIYGDFKGLGKISLFIGTHDILLPDARMFKAMMEQQGIAINYYEYPRMFHVWMAVTFLKESKVAVNQIAALVK